MKTKYRAYQFKLTVFILFFTATHDAYAFCFSYSNRNAARNACQNFQAPLRQDDDKIPGAYPGASCVSAWGNSTDGGCTGNEFGTWAVAADLPVACRPKAYDQIGNISSCAFGYDCPTGSVVIDNTGRCVLPKDNPKNNPMSCPGEGNPVNVATGNKHQVESDYSNNDLISGFEFKRYYSSNQNYDAMLFHVGRVRHSFARGWRYSYSRMIYELNASEIYLIRDNGRSIKYSEVAGNWQSDNDTQLMLSKLFDQSQTHIGWQVIDLNDVIETYDLDGKLIQISHRGDILTLAYDIGIVSGGDGQPSTLDKITDPYNRTIQLLHVLHDSGSYSSLESITDPDGKVYKYGYDDFTNLISVTYPDDTPLDDTDNPTRQYMYEDVDYPSHLTGIIDENSNRYATWAYDDEGRAILSEHANSSEKFIFAYNTDGTTTVTDQLGASRTYTFTEQFGVLKTASVVGDQCTFCEGQDQTITYDANGFVASRTDFQGNVTTYINNSRGLETSRTEASGTPEARTIATEWHSTFRLPTKVTESGKETTFTYDANGKLLTRSEQIIP